jgi:hypothetical protein
MMTVATVAIAMFAAFIAFGQWWTARQKLNLDLFEKRFEVYKDLRNVISEAIQLGRVQQHAGLMNEVFARSQFLFGDEINSSLTKIYSLVGEIGLGRADAVAQISQEFDAVRPLFTPYLAMTQKLPRAPWG